MNREFRGARWRKSTYSIADGDCIEVADGLSDIVPVRDSKDPHGPTLAFTATAWTSFLAAIHTGELPTS
ncbi:DUF397 domain-containing protein [Kitasatospora purpeofusca]|uniref:DUF397 domain-containing protein n=1 Tax=Kitasatospora purpeofusca TaxID=67352 RepID=UPI002A59C3C2|nr:DUF397 domain-containing protein [Kitasatospora purpeofusca]MDY0815166.1 DUF397 domain-containing protein [Kitasatospora purpeofusca]